MPDIAIWNDKKQRQGFIDKAHAIFEGAREDLLQQSTEGVVAVEPDSGEVFFGKTLGEANRAAAEKYLDHWIYFVRLEDPSAALPLPAW